MRRYFLVILLLTSCAHYSISPTSKKPIFVSTISVDARYDLDGQALTRFFISELESYEIKLESSPGTHTSLQCFFAPSSTQNSEIIFTQQILHCKIGEMKFSQRVSLGANANKSYNSNEMHRTLDDSAKETLRLLTPEIANYLKKNF